MDRLDRRILNELQRDASQTMEALAERVGSTPATCHRRYRQLIKSGVIDRKVVIVEPTASDQAITVIIGIVVKSQRPRDQAAFRKFLGSHPLIKMAWMTTGEFDYVAVGAFPDTAAYKKFVDEDLIGSVNFSNFRSYVSIDDIKFDTSRSF